MAGKSLVQLQCHLGIETLAWARLGAMRVVGLDFSDTALAHARSLAERCGLADRARFVLADVHDAVRALDQHAPFDVVYVSVGALLWLPSVRRWAQIYDLLCAEGALYVREVHPMLLGSGRRERQRSADRVVSLFRPGAAGALERRQGLGRSGCPHGEHRFVSVEPRAR